MPSIMVSSARKSQVTALRSAYKRVNCRRVRDQA